MRTFLKNPAVRIAFSTIFLLIGGYLILSTLWSRPATLPDTAYFYDLNTNRIFVASSQDFAPIQTDSGPNAGAPAGVRLFIFTCGPSRASFDGLTLDQARERGAVPGWFQMYTPETLAQIHAAGGQVDINAILSGELNRMVDSSLWLPAAGEEAGNLRRAARDLCGKVRAVLANP